MRGSYGHKYLKIARRKYPDCLADSGKHQMAAAQVYSWIFSSVTYFSSILFCVVNLMVLGLKAYWYTGSAFIPQSYLKKKEKS